MSDWKVKKLADIADIITGFAFKSSQMSDTDGIPLIKIKNIYNRTVSQNCDSYLLPQHASNIAEKYYLRQNDILVAMTGQGSVGRIGKMHRVKNTYLVNQRVGIIRPKESIVDALFIFHQIANERNESIYFNLASGAGQPNLSPNDIGNLEVIIPPFQIQQRVGSILSAYDDLIENNLKRIKLLEELAQRTYEEWFVKFRINGEQLEINPESGLPEGWERKRLNKVASVNKNSLKKGFIGCIKYVDISSVSTGSIDSWIEYEFNDAPGRARRILQHGDIIWSCVRPNRKSYSIVWKPKDNLIGSTGFAVISPKKLPSTYLYNFLTTDAFVGYLSNMATGAAYPAVTTNVFEDAEIIIPPEYLLKKFDTIAHLAFQQISILKDQNLLLKEARDILLPHLMNGTLSVEKLEEEYALTAEPVLEYGKN